MASSSQIKALLKSYIDSDDSRFYATAMQLAADEAKRGHGKVAEEIRKLIDDARSSKTLLAGHKFPTLIVRPNKELADLLSVSYPKIRLADMTLESKLLIRINRLLEEQRNIEKITAHGLNPRKRLLFTGLPGCGKTMSASAIAGELGLPLFVVRLDGLITKFMGESIAKLRAIFDSIQNTRAVYLFDEFDSIGTHRGVTNDVGEIKRILNSFLMYIEEDNSNSIIIAATNHPQSLDYALFRRFDELLEFGSPTKELIAEFLRKRLSEYKINKKDIEKLSSEAEGLSFADIEIACDDAVKMAILSNRKTIKLEELYKTLEERISFHDKYKKSA
jgi:SpoVK/Ycf46/Vps4 family AAA+-type ATPase